MSRAIDTERIGWRTYAVVAVVVAAVLGAMLVVSANSHAVRPRAVAPGDDGTSTAPAVESDLTFGVWGTKAEVAAYRSIVAAYERKTPGTHIRLAVYPSADALAEVLDADKADVPNVYLLRTSDLGDALAHRRNKPLHDLVTDRGVNPGDDYSRNAVAAFSADDDLQCMPYTASPMVLYYNTDLIDADKMAARGLTPPATSLVSFSLDQFRAAARFASRAHGGRAAGVAVAPTLRGLAPFVLSGGGKLFDDPTSPTRLALGDDGSDNALRQVLQVLRDPSLTLSRGQLAKKSALEWFEEGRLGMVAGYRSLVPVLRAVPGLHFDVLPFPNLGEASTIGDIRGLCLGSSQPRELAASADFLTYLVGDDAMTRVARIGSLEPANLRVAFGDAFQQPNRQPLHGRVFTALLRYIEPEPLDVPWDRLERAVGPQLKKLFTAVYLDDLDQRLDAIDKRSQRVLSSGPKPSSSSSPSSSSPAAPSSGSTP